MNNSHNVSYYTVDQIEAMYERLKDDPEVILGKDAAISAALERPESPYPYVSIATVDRGHCRSMTITLTPDEAYAFFVQLASVLGKVVV